MVAHAIDPADHGGLVGYVMRSYRRSNGPDLDDLEQELWVGLCEAAGRYDPAAGCTFATYAIACLEGVAKSYLGNALADRPRRLRVRGNPLARVAVASQIQIGSRDDADEVVRRTTEGVSPDHAPDLADRDEFAVRSRELLQILDPDDRGVLKLLIDPRRGWERVRSPGQVARKLGVGVGVVTGAMRRVRVAARLTFGARCPADPGRNGVKFTAAEIEDMRRRRAAGESYPSIARGYGVDKHTVKHSVSGVSRAGKTRLKADTDRASPPPPPPRQLPETARRVLRQGRRLEFAPVRVVTPHDREHILARFLAGDDRDDIARDVGCHVSLVYYVARKAGFRMADGHRLPKPEKIPTADMPGIADRIRSGETVTAVAAEYGAKPCTLSNRLTKYLRETGGPPLYAPGRHGWVMGPGLRASVLERVLAGEKKKDIARDIGCTASTVFLVARGAGLGEVDGYSRRLAAAKVPAADIPGIVERVRRGETFKAVAAGYGVRDGTLGQRVYRYLRGTGETLRVHKGPPAKLTDAALADAHGCSGRGESLRAAARALGVSHTTLARQLARWRAKRAADPPDDA